MGELALPTIMRLALQAVEEIHGGARHFLA
jgi:hypothetical protein